MAVGGRQVELVERADRQMFEHAIDRNIDRVFGRPVGGWDAAVDGGLDVEVVAAEARVDFEEDALSLGLVAAAGGVILAEFFGRQVGRDQCLWNEREIEINGHGNLIFRRLSF